MDENRMAKDQDQLSEKELVVVAGGNDDRTYARDI